MKQTVITLILAICGFSAVADVVKRVNDDDVSPRSLLETTWHSPVAMEQRHDSALSAVGGHYALRHEDEPLDARRGNSEQTFSFLASTYLHHRESTLWGSARYDNATVKGMRWNETSDIDVVSPYLLADSVPTGTMYGERYAFMGGYAGHSGRWHYGATLAYEAGQYYRRVDPRPRNVTANLDLSVGGGVDLRQCRLSLAIGFNRYKQTNDVTFYSEMGNDKLFHLTGLVTDYGRFGGTGYSTYYRGYRWQVVATLSPQNIHGLWAAVRLSRMSVDNVITSLNKLPMANVTLNRADVECGWLQSRWGVVAGAHLSRRLGAENVFGDAAAGVYPEIGSLSLYRENRAAVTLRGVYSHFIGRWRLTARAAAWYDHLNVIYLDPQCRQLVNRITTAAELTAAFSTLRHTTAFNIGASIAAPTADELLLSTIKDELAGLSRQLMARHNVMSHSATAVTVGLRHTHAIGSRFAIEGTVAYRHGFHYNDVASHSVNASLRFLF